MTVKKNEPVKKNICRELVSELPVLICRFNNDFKLTFANKSYCRYYKKSKKYFIGRSFLDFIPPEFQKELKQKLKSLSPKNPDFQYKHKVIKSNGQVKWQRWLNKGHFDKKGKILDYSAIGEDITSEVITKDAALDERRRFNTLLSNLLGMAYRCGNDKNWTMEFVSAGCYNLTGYKADDLIGNKKIAFNDIILPEFQKELWDTWQKKLKNRQVFKGEYKIRTASGKIKWVWEQGRGVFDEKGKLLALEGFITDITQIKDYEKKLKRANETLEKKVEERTEELNVSNEELQNTVEELNSSNEELKNATEELNASNEELAVLNETLEQRVKERTEELEALNEELKAANDELKGFNEKLQLRDKFQNIITAVASKFITAPFHGYDGVVNDALLKIGKFLKVDRSYLFLYSQKNKTITNTHEWCVKGVKAYIKELKDVPLKTMPWLKRKLNQKETIYINDINKLPASASEEKKEFKKEKIQSLVTVPIFYDKKLAGFLGLDSVKKKRKWRQTSGDLLKIMGAIIINSYKTREHRAELIKSREIFSALFSSMTEISALHEIVFNKKGKAVNYRLIDCNKAFVKTTGIKKKDAVGCLATEVYKTKKAPYLKEYADVAITGKPRRFSVYYKPMDKYFDISVVCPRKNHFATITNDISELKKIENDLISSNKNLKEANEQIKSLYYRNQAVLKAVPDIIMETDKNKVYTWANKQGYKFFGGDVIGKKADYYFDGVQDTFNKVGPLFEGGRNTVYVESRQRRRDGQIRLLAWLCAPVKDEKGKIKGAISSARDITESRKMEIAVKQANIGLKKANEELLALDEMKNNFLSNVSHELKTPLVSVKGYIDLMRLGKSGAINNIQHKQLSVCLKNIDKLVWMINNLLEFSKSLKTPKLKFSQFNINATAAEAADTVKNKAYFKNINVKVNVPKKPLIIKADKVKIYYCLINLLDNAVKFTPDGGRVDLKVEKTKDKAVLTVKDTGIGINKKDIPLIFNRFYQADSSLTKRYSGLGLGLAICGETIDAHGGEIKTVSALNKGTVFKIKLPLK